MKHSLALPLTITTDHSPLLRALAWSLAALGLVAPLAEIGGLPLLLVGLVGWGLAGAVTFFQGRLRGGLIWGACYAGGYLFCTTWLSSGAAAISTGTQSPAFVSILFFWALTAFGAVMVSGLVQSSTRGEWLSWLLVAAIWGVALGLGGYVGVILGYLLAALLKVGILLFLGLALGGGLAGWAARRVQAALLLDR